MIAYCSYRYTAVNDESTQAHSTQLNDIESRGTNITVLDQVNGSIHPRIAPLAVMLRFYLDIEKVAVERGLNPDEPIGLKKVTKTL